MTNNIGKAPIIFNITDKKLGTKAKYYDYKNTLGTFLEKKCFTKEENVAVLEKFKSDYSEYLELKLSAAIDKLKREKKFIYKNLLLNKSFKGSVCTFKLDKEIKGFKKAGYLELICDDKRISKKHYKDINRAIQSIMRIKSTDVLFNGNPIYVNDNLAIANSVTSYFKVSF